MGNRKEPFVTGEYYHIYNRGVDKRDLFNDLHDLDRFRESIKQFNQVDVVGSLDRQRQEKSSRALTPTNEKSEPLVAIIAFCINPNHFHFLLKQLVDGGIAKFMQKTTGGYTSYFNKKANRSGALLQGTFKSKLVDNDNYFRKIFAYVNQNYLVHDIPKSKQSFVFASDMEYENEVFDFVSKEEGEKILEMFASKNDLRKHCSEIVSIIRKERGKVSLEDPDELP